MWSNTAAKVSIDILLNNLHAVAQGDTKSGCLRHYPDATTANLAARRTLQIPVGKLLAPPTFQEANRLIDVGATAVFKLRPDVSGQLPRGTDRFRVHIHYLLCEAVVPGCPNLDRRLAVWAFWIALQPRLQAELTV